MVLPLGGRVGRRQLNILALFVQARKGLSLFGTLSLHYYSDPDDFLKYLISTSIFLQYQQEVPGGNTDEGLVLTSTGEFYEFDIDKS